MVVCSLGVGGGGGEFIQCDSATKLTLSSIGGIVGGVLHMLNRNRHC